MSEDPDEHHTGRTAHIGLPLTVDALVTKVHANRQGIACQTSGQLLERLLQRLHILADPW